MILKLKIFFIRQLLIYVIVDKHSGQKFLTFATTYDSFLLNFLCAYAKYHLDYSMLCIVFPAARSNGDAFDEAILYLPKYNKLWTS